MKALITGGASGIGEAISKKLSLLGYDVILVDKNKKKLEKIKDEFNTEIEIISMDISSKYNCQKLYNKFKDDDIDIIVNCAGIGLYGDFTDIKVDKDLDLIDLNIKALHILTKLFLQNFEEKKKGYILNIGCGTSFTSRPLMTTYAASKSYVLNLTVAISEELKIKKSNVYVGCFCPENVNTKFNEKLGIKAKQTITAEEAADIAINGMFKKKTVIVTNFKQKLNIYFSKILPRRTVLKANYKKIKQG